MAGRTEDSVVRRRCCVDIAQVWAMDPTGRVLMFDHPPWCLRPAHHRPGRSRRRPGAPAPTKGPRSRYVSGGRADGLTGAVIPLGPRAIRRRPKHGCWRSR